MFGLGDALSLGSSLLGAIGGGDASGDAAGAQSAAAAKAQEMAEKYGKLSIEELRKSLEQARADIDKGLGNSIITTSPYQLAGDQALDALMSSLGLARQKSSAEFRYLGNLNTQDAEARKAFEDKKKNGPLDEGINAWYDYTGSRPEFGVDQSGREKLLKATSEEKIAFLKDQTTSPGSIGLMGKEGYSHLEGMAVAPGIMPGMKAVSDKLFKALEEFDPEAAAKEYESLMTPEQKARLHALSKGEMDINAEDSAKMGVKNFLDSPEAQLLWGTSSADANKTPLERFQESPGYQFQQDEMAKAQNRQAASKGYLDSPRLAMELQERGGQLANQEFGKYQAQVTDSFRTYQNKLAGVTGIGVGVASQTSNQQFQAGQSQANAEMSTAQQIAQQYQWMGTASANAQLAQGQAQAQGMMYGQQYQNQMMGNLAGIGQQLASGFSSKASGGGGWLG